MKARSLGVFPIAFAGAFALAAAASGGALPNVLAAQNEVGKCLAAIGCFAAALAFEEGDYLRRAWFYSGLCYVFLLGSDALGVSAVAAIIGARGVGVGQAALAFLGNAASVIGTWMLARAWSVAGFDDEAPARRRRFALLGAAAVVSLAVTGLPLLRDVRAVLAGDAAAAVSIASDLGDTICLALVAPVLQTALAVRDGSLRWPWGLLAASGFAWIVYDGTSGMLEAQHVESAGWLVGSEAWRGIANGCMFAAGLAQRSILAPEEATPAT